MLSSPTLFTLHVYVSSYYNHFIYHSDCALYAMAVATSLATNADPASVIFDQVDLRSHFRQCMETAKWHVSL